jgi:hypothetical protein
MSAAMVVLPKVWATCCAAPVQQPTERKAPHRLHLVRASAAEFPRTVRTLPEPEYAFYRKYTEVLLRRYMMLSLEAGRVPSLLGRELFNANISHSKVQAFDDSVIFVHDMTNILSRLSPGRQHLVRRIALQGYTQAETAALLGIGLSSVVRRYYDAIDKLTAILLELKMLQPYLHSSVAAIESGSVENLSRGPGFGLDDNMFVMN